MAIIIPAFKARGVPTPMSKVYVRVERASGGKAEGKWHGLAKVYFDQASAAPVVVGHIAKTVDGEPVLDEKQQPVMDPVMGMPSEFLEEIAVQAPWIENGVPEQLLYAALKKLERLAGAVDV